MSTHLHTKISHQRKMQKNIINDHDDEDDETSRLVTIRVDPKPSNESYPRASSENNLRSILRKRPEKTFSIDAEKELSLRSMTVNATNVVNNHDDQNDDHALNERDSDYTGDEDVDDEEEEEEEAEEQQEEREEEGEGSCASSSRQSRCSSNNHSSSVEERNKNNEQEHCSNYSRHQRRDEFFRTSPAPTFFVSPLELTRTETGLIETGTATATSTTSAPTPFYGNEHSSSSSRTPACVKFTNEQPIIIHRSSSTPQLSEFHLQQRSSITFLNMKDEIATATTPLTTAASTTMVSSSGTLTAEFRPVYVSPLKYRPLVGLSANDNRLLLEKRVSLLGKPLVFHPVQKRSPSYRRIQLHIYNFLERPHGWKAVLYHTFVFLTVFLCLFLSVVATMPEYESIASTVLLQTEILVVIWLATELILRVWSAGCRSRYQTLLGRLRFMRKPFCALDFVMIIATLITLCVTSRGGNGVFAASALRGLRFFQILRMLRMDRRAGTWKLLGSVVYAHRQELITTIYIGFLVLIFSSFIMFLVEKDTTVQPKATPFNGSQMTTPIPTFLDADRHKFETFADALWWGIITLCTVGYGDKVPSSHIGKLIAAICSFIGISFFALPAGILGSGFALKVQQQQRQKHYKRRKIPAVLLIQNLWRVYAADEKSLSKATWKVHVRPPKKEPNPSTSSQGNPHAASTFSSFRMRNNQSFLNRVSFRRRTPVRDTSTTPMNNINANLTASSVRSIPNATVAAMRSCIDTLSETATLTRSPSITSPPEGSSSDNEDDHLYFANDVESLTPIHRHAIRFIRKSKYFVSRRKFREALRPYDVTDVIEQYSTGNVDMLARMKYLQARLDKVLGTPKSIDSYESGPSLASRICKIERQVDTLDVKVERLCQLASSLLEGNTRQQQNSTSSAPPPTPTTPTTPIVINRYRTGARPRICHRHRRRRTIHHRTSVSNTPQPAAGVPASASFNATTINASRTNSIHPNLPADLSTREFSRESLISLYWLFQDHLNSSRNASV